MIKHYKVEKDNYDDAGYASIDIKKYLKNSGFESSIIKRISIASYEAEINLVIHSLGGEIGFDIDDEERVHLYFDDIGPGIADIEKAMQKGYSTASKKAREFGFGAGMGLDNMKNCADIFEINSSKDGTHIHMVFE